MMWLSLVLYFEIWFSYSFSVPEKQKKVGGGGGGGCKGSFFAFCTFFVFPLCVKTGLKDKQSHVKQNNYNLCQLLRNFTEGNSKKLEESCHFCPTNS